MTEPPRRKRFQIHLSTAIVMMLVAGGLIWANMIPWSLGNIPLNKGGPTVYETAFGFPISWTRGYSMSPAPPFPSLEAIADSLTNLLVFIFDVIVAIVIIFASWFLCEWLIRRRAARKGA